MTEKRYTHNILGSVFKDGKLFALTDGESQARTLCIELNELNDKNIELHIQNDFLKDENKHMRNVLEENKQLKQRIKELEVENEAQSDAIDGLQEFMAHHDLEGLE